ncbi:MAG TPA: hypothetical protein VE993_01565 [Stellaceae bacterium]|nr:hypothetical protein [Stellaceae bacterium]
MPTDFAEEFPLETLKQARAALDEVTVSHFETFLRALLPLAKNVLDTAIADREHADRGTPPKSGNDQAGNGQR